MTPFVQTVSHAQARQIMEQTGYAPEMIERVMAPTRSTSIVMRPFFADTA